MTSNDLPSWPLTNSLLMNLQVPGLAFMRCAKFGGGGEISVDKVRGKS